MAAHIEKHRLKNGKYCWRVIVEQGIGPDGKRKRIYRNISGTKKDAEALMAQLLSELQTGSYIEPCKLTLCEYLRDWLKNYAEANLSPTTVDSYTFNLEKHVVPHLGHLLLQQLKPMHIQNLYKDLLENGRTDGKGGLSARSILYIHRNLREALQHAARLQLIGKNPADFVTLPRATQYIATVYSEEELINLLRVSENTDMELIIVLAVALGLRRGELLGLKWSDIDLGEHNRITIRHNHVQTTKGNITKSPKTTSSIRTLELPDGLVAVLRKHKDLQEKKKKELGDKYFPDNYVCCQTNGAPYCPGYVSKKFAAFLKAHGLKQIRLHDLRHSNATLMLKYGIPAKIASDILGHSKIAITLDLYSHSRTLDDLQKQAAEKIDRLFNAPYPEIRPETEL